MLGQSFSLPSRSQSPSFHKTVDPEFFENHPVYSTPSQLNTTPAMGEYVAIPPQGVGTVLKNSDTETKLEFIQKLKKLGVDKYVDLPQLVVVGDQSSGKSSVLQAITKLPFRVHERMCTRFATEVALQRSVGPESISVQIKMAPDDSTSTDGDSEEEDSETVRVLECNTFPFGTPEFAQEFERVLAVASSQILGAEADSQVLSKATLTITVKGPNEIDLTIVDIPGLVSVGHEAFETARALVTRYIDNPKSIILAVAHPADPGTQEVFQMIKNIPNKESRVIGVITKCDRKQEGAENWILDTIKNERVHHNPHYLTQGWFGLRNRLPVEEHISNQERDMREAEFFIQGVWTDLNQNRLGINHLRAALTKMHNTHITNSIPELIPEIKEQLSSCKKSLAQLGKPRGSPSEQLECMVALASTFSRFTEDALDGYYHNLPDHDSAKLRKIVQDNLEEFKDSMEDSYLTALPDLCRTILTSLNDETWRSSILEDHNLKYIETIIQANRGREFSDEVNQNVMSVLWLGGTQEWKSMASDLIENLGSGLMETMKLLVKEATAEQELQSNTIDWLSSHLPTATASATDELSKVLSDEARPWTLMPAYSTLIGTLYNKYISRMAKSLATLPNDSHTTRTSWENKIKLWLANNKDVDAVLNTYVRLKAYYEVAMARFIDSVALQVIERHLLGPSSPLRMFTPSYVVKMAKDEPELLKRIAGENEDKAAERLATTAEITSLKAALATARSYGFYNN